MDSRLIIRPRALPKPLLLKDYLLDDMSSCSSNGFKSFPRRKCCTSVPFLHEFDLKTKQKKYSNFNKTPRKPSLSAFQIVMTALKRLPFSAAKLPEKKNVRNSFLPRSFSKKILKRSGFWKRKPDQKEIGQSKCFDKLIKEDSGPPDRSYSSITANRRKSNRWSSDLTVLEECSNLNSSSEVNLNLPEERNDVVEQPNKVACGNRMDVTNGDGPTDSTTSDGSGSANYSTNMKKKQRSSSTEKEQFSPVSVLDCPFDDEDEEDEVSSPFQHRLARVEGTKKKLMKKIQMLEGLAKLEPMNLSNQFALQTHSDDESIEAKFISDIEDEEEDKEDLKQEAKQKAKELLHRAKAAMPSNDDLKLKPCMEKLLLDFFIERVSDSENQCPGGSEMILEEAEDWINGQKRRELLVEWDVQKSRKAYVKEMERRGEWKRLDQENREVALELETEVFAALLDEFVLDISI
ncbi:hypothetical protein CDL12_07402 [Handroanthus impetiginosus]|uniref:DUF4378 domain-containing protein n=1 Tax=Handroanthus impetiginosus TaxID=429701 RepID=A0A2G9HRI9_9LAMI|nr:hypothetical protein CDL12_07402 [Handroanthus impetiginosus]